MEEEKNTNNEEKKKIEDVQSVQNVQDNKIDKLDKLDNNEENIDKNKEDLKIENHKNEQDLNLKGEVDDSSLSNIQNVQSVQHPKSDKMDKLDKQNRQNNKIMIDKLDKKDIGQGDEGEIKDIKQEEKEEIEEIMGQGAVDKILSLLYKTSPLSYSQISKENGLDYDNVAKTISRYSDPNKQKYYFQSDKKEGKTKFFKLSQFGEEFIKEKIKEYKQRITHFKRKEEEKLVFLKGKEELMIEAKQVFSLYKKEIGEQVRQGSKSICMDFDDLSSYSPVLAESLMASPIDVLEILEVALEETELIKNAKIRIKNLPESSTFAVEQVRSEHLGQIIQIQGRSASISSVRGRITNIRYECPSCGTTISKPQVGFIEPPKRCSCGRKGNFRILKPTIINLAHLVLEDLQEKSTSINLQRVECTISDDLTDTKNIQVFHLANEIKAVGILKEIPIFRKGRKSADIGFEFEILHGELFDPEIDAENLTKEEVEEIIGLQSRIDEPIEIQGAKIALNLKEICDSIAPDVYGHERKKEALILQASAPKNVLGKETRNKPNILMIGDPGVGKTVMGDFMINITPNSKKAVGGGSSAVGITGSVVKEEESLGGYRLEAGALPLAKEILFLDEMNNLSDEDKPRLQQGMADQKITIHKANIHAELTVTAGILAAANPKEGYFQPGSTISQFKIPPAILDRFDLIFVMRDVVDEEEDRKIAQIMLKRERGLITPRYSKEFLKKFFIYVRNQPEPEITKEIAEKIENIYVSYRMDETTGLKLRPRFLESFNRFVRASARIRGGGKVEGKDINSVFKIFSESQYDMSMQKFFELKKRKPKLEVEEGLEVKQNLK